MASAVDSYASSQPNIETNLNAAACEPNGSGPTPDNDGQTSTPTSSTIGTPRMTTNNRITRKRRAVRAGKSKRVRTGCLTCRERHLKCDEAQGQCQNCQKSDRICRRGIRLNFIDTQTVAPPHYTAPRPGARLAFRDESRHIASEYVGGFEKYPSSVPDIPLENDGALESELFGYLSPALEIDSLIPSFEDSFPDSFDYILDGSHPPFYPILAEQVSSHVPCTSTERVIATPKNDNIVSGPDEIHLLRVFTEEIGPWMDSLNASKHFSHTLPFHATDDNMLLKAFMACGARHFYRVNPNYNEKASYLYDSTSQVLLDFLQNQECDFARCATTATILGMYEIMCSRNAHGMDYFSRVRDLIEQCHWGARTPGLGGACFWFSVSTEVLTCLRFNCFLTWDPDTWDLDLYKDESQPYIAGSETLWARRIVYICAKLVNYRFSISQSQGSGLELSEVQKHKRHQEWDLYNEWLTQWEKSVPRSMLPLGYIHPSQGGAGSSFPVVFLVGQSAVIARLFYHTSQLLLCEKHRESNHNSKMQQNNALYICGIVAHIKDRGISSLLIRFLVFAAEYLTSREAQEEALELLDYLANRAGWQSESIKQEIQQAWGWTSLQQILPTSADTNSSLGHEHHSMLDLNTPFSSQLRAPLVVSPTLITADLSIEGHSN